MAYFDNFPKVLLPSFSDNRTSTTDFVANTNIFKRGKIRDDIFESSVAFDKYSIVGDDRPDNVAQKLYGSPDLDWVVLISNNIINVRDEWPMGQNEFQRYLENKYGNARLSGVHHYETREVRDSKGRLLQQAGLWVDEDHSFTFTENGLYTTHSQVDSVSNYQYEDLKNDKKRNIHVVKARYLSQIQRDMRDLLTYEDSSQYINSKTKKGDNLRIISPR